MKIFLTNIVKKISRDFPGGAVVKNPPANAGDMGSSPGPGRSHMPCGQKPKHKTEQYCNKFNKDFKNGLHQRNLKKKKKTCPPNL